MAKLVNIPILNDFIYTLLFNASFEEKRGLKGKYLRAAMNGKAAKHFATNSTREEKEFIMAHFGVEFFYVVAKKSTTLAGLREILEKFEVNKKVSAVRDIAELGVCVTSDKEFLRLLGLMSQSTHHHSFFMNTELLRQGYHIQKWAKNNLNKKDLETREADELTKKVVKLCLNALLVLDSIEGMKGMTRGEMMILLYLYTVSHTYMDDKDILDIFIGSMTKIYYRRSIKCLVQSLCIQQYGTYHDKSYTITAQGIGRVNEYLRAVLNSNFFG